MTGSSGFDDHGSVARRLRLSLQELIRAKRPEPVRSVEELMAPDVFASDDEVDEFVAAVREWRQGMGGVDRS